ncbi:MAG: GNAT family N-acetyltransferase [Acidovorax sp.]|jgi:ribosomal-protein-alanine N-acetyltransferase|nr:GNAT family N-acetyltransferase [Acidovorax sp.]
MSPSPHLHTPRLQLRPLRQTDQGFISSLLGDAQVRQFLGGAVDLQRRSAAVAAYFSGEEGETAWLVQTGIGQLPLGLVHLSPHWDEPCLELSYQFAPGAWGKGYAIEAVQCVRDHVLQDRKQERVLAETQAANTASCRLLQRLGMTELRRLQRFGAEQVIYTTAP